jgi:hypothetical protein
MHGICKSAPKSNPGIVVVHCLIRVAASLELFPYLTRDAGAELKIADIATAARSYTMLISCSANGDELSKK